MLKQNLAGNVLPVLTEGPWCYSSVVLIRYFCCEQRGIFLLSFCKERRSGGRAG